MNINLLRAMIAQNVVTKGTEVEARYQALDMSGCLTHTFTSDFVYMGSTDKGDDIVLHLADAKLATKRNIPMNDIITIDGMPPERLASVYNIGPDGGKVKAARRRGRKPKGWVEEA